jgi:hypothetical protein
MVILARRELPSSENPAKAGTHRSQLTFQPTLAQPFEPIFVQPLLDELPL